jgi:diaminohydroxyphosphoribosylaminopyrimidine deaminase/5-amino-6-(5-phosphoribosylamino)uracil reductase
VLGVPAVDGNLDLEVLRARLAERGMASLFIEGGGDTVSRFLAAGLLDRLQIAVAPLVTGAGTPGLRLPASSRLGDCLRAPGRAYRMGADVLFDCDLRGGPPEPGPSGLSSIY